MREDVLRGKATESNFDTGGTPLVGLPPGVDGMWGGVGTQSQEEEEEEAGHLSSGGNTCWSSSRDGVGRGEVGWAAMRRCCTPRV